MDRSSILTFPEKTTTPKMFLMSRAKKADKGQAVQSYHSITHLGLVGRREMLRIRARVKVKLLEVIAQVKDFLP